jgi:hypothetical protein
MHVYIISVNGPINATQMGRQKDKITAKVCQAIPGFLISLSFPDFSNDIYFIRPLTPRVKRRRGYILHKGIYRRAPGMGRLFQLSNIRLGRKLSTSVEWVVFFFKAMIYQWVIFLQGHVASLLPK